MAKRLRKVLEKLLDKYADEGLENLDVLKVTPFDEFGTPKEIIESFGGIKNYLKAITGS